MNSKYTLLFVVCSGLFLSACDNNNGGNNAGDDGGNQAPANTLAIFGNQAADDAPLPISAQLETDIVDTFGDADNTPTDVIAGDTVQTVIDKANAN